MSLGLILNNEDDIFNREDYVEVAWDFKAFTDSLGLRCNQAHAPFHSSTGEAERDNFIFQKIIRSMEIASILGAKIIVVHPKQHLNYAEHADELFEMNVEFYRSFIPYCEKFGIKVAVENMWQGTLRCEFFRTLRVLPKKLHCSRLHSPQRLTHLCGCFYEPTVLILQLNESFA